MCQAVLFWFLSPTPADARILDRMRAPLDTIMVRSSAGSDGAPLVVRRWWAPARAHRAPVDTARL